MVFVEVFLCFLLLLLFVCGFFGFLFVCFVWLGFVVPVLPPISCAPVSHLYSYHAITFGKKNIKKSTKKNTLLFEKHW